MGHFGVTSEVRKGAEHKDKGRRRRMKE